ncbi:MAG: MATE family efflux transporter [Oscillospiraceae bacterium]|jgi:Na+-driven multidrug efflux pump
MKTRTHDLTAGSIPQHMLRLAAPLILGNILQQLYNAVDAFILGRCAGGLEFAAVGIAGSVMNLFLFMITGACTGVSVIFAQLFGANDLETFRREHFLSLVFGLLCTLACSAIGFLCLPLLLRVIQTPQELTGYVTAYLTVILISLPAAFVYNLYGALLRAIGRTARYSFVTGLHQSSLYIGKLLVQGAVNTGGTDMISAYTATTRIEGFANSFGDIGAAATSVLVAQNLGAGKPERVQKTFRSSLVLMLAMGLLSGLVMYLTAGATVGFMLGAYSGPAFESGREYMQLISLFYIFCFTGNTFAGYFDGLGRVTIPFIGAASHIALRVVLSWLWIDSMGMRAVALATGIGWVMVNLLWEIIRRRSARKAPVGAGTQG